MGAHHDHISVIAHSRSANLHAWDADHLKTGHGGRWPLKSPNGIGQSFIRFPMILDRGIHSRIKLQHMDDLNGGSVGFAEENHMLLSVTGTGRKVGCEQDPIDHGMSRYHLAFLPIPVLSVE